MEVAHNTNEAKVDEMYTKKSLSSNTQKIAFNEASSSEKNPK
jgi:hypothetical protein